MVTGWPTGRIICNDVPYDATRSSTVLDLSSQPANKPPSVGMIRYIQTCPNALCPTNNAGPKLRAGLRDVPDTLMNARCKLASVMPMIRAPIAPGPFGPVAERITTVKIVVPRNSATIAAHRPYAPQVVSPSPLPETE